MLWLLCLVLFLPNFDFISQFLFCFVMLLAFLAKFPNCTLQFLNLYVFYLSILLRSELFHGLEQLLLFSLDLDVVRGHVFIFVLLKNFWQVLVQTFNTWIDLLVALENFFPDFLGFRGALGQALADSLTHHGHRGCTIHQKDKLRIFDFAKKRVTYSKLRPWAFGLRVVVTVKFC